MSADQIGMKQFGTKHGRDVLIALEQPWAKELELTRNLKKTPEDSEKEFMVTDKLSIFGDVEYDTNTKWEHNTGVSYFLNKDFSITAGYHSEHKLGAGLIFRF